MSSRNIPYTFPDAATKRNFKVQSAQTGESIVSMITKALKEKYPHLFKKK